MYYIVKKKEIVVMMLEDLFVLIYIFLVIKI